MAKTSTPLIASNTQPEVWTIGQLVEAVRGQHAERVIRLPTFQRHLVWSPLQRKALIDSLLRGFPIGSFLLHERTQGKGNLKEYVLVDGLQRTNTLKEYGAKPLTLAPASVIPDQLVAAVVDLAPPRKPPTEDGVRAALESWMRKIETIEQGDGFRPDTLVEHLLEVGILKKSPDSAGHTQLAHGLDALRKGTDLANRTIPVVTYSGPVSALPDIFERINTKGTKLSKYEIFAATWLESDADVKSDDVRQAVMEKYEYMMEEGYQIEGMSKNEELHSFNLFEYLFGLGKVLVRERPLLFGEEGASTDTEPVSFALATVLRGVSLDSIHELPDHMPRDAKKSIETGAMEAAIRGAAAAVEQWLAPYIGMRLNATGSDKQVAHGELQVVSMIARAAAGRWDTRGNFAERPGWKADWDRLARALPQHYLYDLVRAEWRGPLYTLLFNRVWDSSEGGGSIIGPAAHYSRCITREEWDSALDSWFADQLRRTQRARPHVRSLDRAFLKYIYTDILTHKEEQETRFEIEHLYPVSRLTRYIPKASPGWPISCIANLALFEKALNREKSAKTIAEYLESDDGKRDRSMIDRLVIGNAQDIRISDAGITEPTYRRFLEGRWVLLKERLFKSLRVEGGRKP